MRYVLAIALSLAVPCAASGQSGERAPDAALQPPQTVSTQPADARAFGPAVSGTASQQPQRVSATLEGRQFGQHVSGMAPEHARLHGELFGECVSELAITGECPHHDHE